MKKPRVKAALNSPIQAEHLDAKKNYTIHQEIFNKVTGVAKQHSTFHSELNFDECNKAMTDQANGQGALKPNFVAIHGKMTRERYAWSEIHIAVAVKPLWETGLKQAAVYGRFMLDQNNWQPLQGLDNAAVY